MNYLAESRQLQPQQLDAIRSQIIDHRQCLLQLLAILFVQLSVLCTQLFTKRAPIPHHTSILTGQAWVLELMTGHPDCIKINLGVTLETFSALVRILNDSDFTQSRNGVTVEEQLAIYLYTCVTGLSSRLVAERFQRSPDTITR